MPDVVDFPMQWDLAIEEIESPDASVLNEETMVYPLPPILL